MIWFIQIMILQRLALESIGFFDREEFEKAVVNSYFTLLRDGKDYGRKSRSL